MPMLGIGSALLYVKHVVLWLEVDLAVGKFAPVRVASACIKSYVFRSMALSLNSR